MKKQEQKWRNRIIGHGEESPDQLLANPLNWRIHPKAQQDALAGVLSEVGWVQSIIVNRRTGCVVDGHLRVALAISHGEESVPVVYVDLSPEEEAEVLATLDPIAAMAVKDQEKFEELLRGIQTTETAVQDLITNLAAMKDVPRWDGELVEDDLGGTGDIDYVISVRVADARDRDRCVQLLSEAGYKPVVRRG